MNEHRNSSCNCSHCVSVLCMHEVGHDASVTFFFPSSRSRTPTSTGPLSRNHTPAGKTRQSVGGNPVPFNTPFRQVAPRNTPKSLPKTQSVADKENVLSCTGKTKVGLKCSDMIVECNV